MTLSRRHFIRLVGGSGATLAILGPGPLAAEASGPSPRPAIRAGDGAGSGTAPGAGAPVLVVVTLYGGNDGLNTVIPVDDPRYGEARGDLAVDPATTLALADGFGLHPSLGQSKALWDDGRLAVVHGVGFADLDRSHFHCMDTWQAGDEQDHTTGWLGRWLDVVDAGPLTAVSVGPTLPLLLRGRRRSPAVVDVGPLKFPGGADLRAPFELAMAADAAHSPLAARAAESGRDLLAVVDDVGPLMAGGRRGGSRIGAQLEVVAELIAGGVPARVYSASHKGFDTHAGQAARHPQLLAEFDAALGTFLGAVGDRPVVVLAHSEFGRRAAVNGSGGTDHGKAGPVLLAGSTPGLVRGGFHGEPSPLDDLDDGDQRATTDFRSVYGGLLEAVLDTPAADILPGAPAPLALVS